MARLQASNSTGVGKTHPILFSTPMVQALLDGRKSMTRRVMKPQPSWVIIDPETDKPELCHDDQGNYGAIWYSPQPGGPDGADVDWTGEFVPCPYGQPGDLLWVRETLHNEDGDWVYASDGAPLFGADGKWLNKNCPKAFVPSIHMPRWASRLTLRITDVRVERVQEIGIEDVHREGIGRWRDYEDGRHVSAVTARNDFHRLWDSINSKRGYGWDANPLVWVVSFEVIQANVDEVLRCPSE